MDKITDDLVIKFVSAAIDEAVLGLEEASEYLEHYQQEEYTACLQARDWLVGQLKESITSS